MGAHLIGVYLVDVYLMDIHLMAVHLMGIHLTSMHGRSDWYHFQSDLAYWKMGSQSGIGSGRFKGVL